MILFSVGPFDVYMDVGCAIAAGVAASVQRLFFGVSAIDDAVTLEEAGVEEVGRLQLDPLYMLHSLAPVGLL